MILFIKLQLIAHLTHGNTAQHLCTCARGQQLVVSIPRKEKAGAPPARREQSYPEAARSVTACWTKWCFCERSHSGEVCAHLPGLEEMRPGGEKQSTLRKQDRVHILSTMPISVLGRYYSQSPTYEPSS